MKKNTYFKRILSLACMMVMLLSLVSVSVSAKKAKAPIVPDLEHIILELFQPLEDAPEYYVPNYESITFVDPYAGVTVSAADYDAYIQPFASEDVSHEIRDITLELAGIKHINLGAHWGDNLEALADPRFGNVDSVEIPPFPVDGTRREQKIWMRDYGDTLILVNYLFHHHNLQGSQMYFDDNYHWQLCTECGNRAYLANHTDKDNDGKCDFCGNAIRYYNVTVKEAAGGKVTLSADKAAMNGKITVTVTPDAGYHLDSLKFVNANAMHSKRAVWEDTPNAEYHFFMANWDVEVEAIFVKD